MGACNGQDALSVLRESPELPRLILLDLMMPEMDGWQFLLEIENEPLLRSVPVALMSAHPSVRRAFDRTRNDIDHNALLLPKPLNVLRLLALAHDMCFDPEPITAKDLRPLRPS